MAAAFDNFAQQEQNLGNEFLSSYTETNGFAHNTNQWHFHWFAYDYTTCDHDFDYLGFGWSSQDYDEIVLTGMESLQSVYADDATWIDEYQFAQNICNCIVTFRFIELVQRATEQMTTLTTPLVVSSHDSGVIFQLNPAPDRA